MAQANEMTGGEARAGTPVVAFIGDTNRMHAGKNMTQEARQVEILRPACKELLRIEEAARIPELIRRAFQVATSGRPGPVVVAVPEDVCHGTLPFEEEAFAVDARCEAAPSIRCRPAADDLARAAKLLAGAKRPLMLCGGGVHISQAADDVSAFARAQAIPLAHTMTGKGSIACTDPLSAGLFGRYDRIANALIEEADVLLVAGCKLGEIATKRFTIPKKGKNVIHLDIFPEEFGRTYQPAVAVWGDVREGIRGLGAGRGFVPDRGFASIGYGLPGAIGAALAGKGRPVVSLTGDGGFNMSLGDLETARRMGLSFAVVVFNNAASGYVKALQHLMYGK